MALATAKLFVEEGAYVFITGRRKQQLARAVEESGKSVTGVQRDAGNLVDLDKLYVTVRAESRVSIFSMQTQASKTSMCRSAPSPRRISKTPSTSTSGAWAQKALPLRHDGGSIIMTGSIASVKGLTRTLRDVCS